MLTFYTLVAVMAVAIPFSFASIAVPVRLVGGVKPWEGRAEYYDKATDTWGSICDEDYYKLDDWPSVLCRQLGFERAFAASQGELMGSGPITYQSPNCHLNNINDMTECGQDPNPFCDHSKDVYVRCTAPVRLIGGKGPREGRAEYYNNKTSTWGSICDIGFRARGWPSLLCRDLGFEKAQSASYAQGESVGTGPISYQSPNCNPRSASDMTKCGQDTSPACDHSKDVYIKCAVTACTESTLPSLKPNPAAIEQPFIIFTNLANATATLNWINYVGTRNSTSTLHPGKSREMRAYIGDRWVARDAEGKLFHIQFGSLLQCSFTPLVASPYKVNIVQ